MQYERRCSVAVFIAIVVTALTAFPVAIVDLAFAGVFLFAVAVLVLPALPFIREHRLPRRSAGLWLACVLMGASALYAGPRSPVVLATMRTIGVVALLEALLLKPRGTRGVAPSSTGGPSR